MGKSKSPAPTPAPQPVMTAVTPPPVQPIERTAANPVARDRAASNNSAELLTSAPEDTKTGMGGSSMLS
jgi:hypothetical protein